MKKGFTLVEILVVLIAVGVLSAIAVPKLFGQTQRAKDSQDILYTGTARKLALALFLDKSIHPETEVFYYDLKNSKMLDAANPDNADKLSKIKGYGVSSKDDIDGRYSGAIGKPKGKFLKVTMNIDGNITGMFWVDKAEPIVIADGSDKKNDDGKFSQFNVSLIEKEYYDNGAMSLAKAIISGKDSKNQGGINKNDANANFNEQYGIEGYVVNTGVSGSHLMEWANEQMGSDYAETWGSSAKVVTTVETKVDKPEKGQVYKASQSLFLGSAKENTVRLALVGSRDIYAKYDGTKFSYYTDADCTQNIDLGNDTNWSMNHDEVEDPFDNKWAPDNYVSPVSISQTNANGFVKDMVSNKGSQNAGFNEKYGIEGYVTNNSMKNTNVKKWLENELPENANTSNVRVLTELHTSTNNMTVGSMYAASQNLYYGNDQEVSVYAQRNVYALVTRKDSDTKYVVRYYYDKECTKPVNIGDDIDTWVKVN